MTKRKATIGDILNLVGKDSYGFEEGDILLCDEPSGHGNWFSVLDVSSYGLRMSNGDTWELSKLSQSEIDKVYNECLNVYNAVTVHLQKEFHELFSKG